MSFPIMPESGQDEDWFLIQDPFGLRDSVWPICAFYADGSAEGLGTGFVIDPWGSMLTATHVVEPLVERYSQGGSDGAWRLRVGSQLGTFPNPGLVYGRSGMPEPAPIQGATILERTSHPEDPPAFLQPINSNRLEIGVDVSRIWPAFSTQGRQAVPLPLRLGRGIEIGSRVQIVGFSEKTPAFQDNGPAAPVDYEERMFGTIGIVTALHPIQSGGHSRWPTIEIEATCRSGMSGGPVFAEDGTVIGVVSRSVEPTSETPGHVSAVWLARAVQMGLQLSPLDHSNPLWYHVWAVATLDRRRVDAVSLRRDLAEARAASLGLNYEVVYQSWQYGSDSLMPV